MISEFKIGWYKHYRPSYFTTINIWSHPNNKWKYTRLIEHLDL